MTYSVSNVKIIKALPEAPIHFVYTLKDSSGKTYKVTRSLHPRIARSADYANKHGQALLEHAKFCEDVDHKTKSIGSKSYSKCITKKLIKPTNLKAAQVQAQLQKNNKIAAKRDKVNEKVINQLKVLRDDNKKVKVQLKKTNIELNKTKNELATIKAVLEILLNGNGETKE